MGLTLQEKEGCKALLLHIPIGDLTSLVDTVCMKKIIVTTKVEAIEGIVVYSSNAVELLRRRKVKKDYIFSYLSSSGIIVPPSESKLTMVNAALRHWGSKLVTQQEFEMMEVDEVRDRVQVPPTQLPHVPADSQDQDSLLCNQFCNWFFHMLNSYHPCMQNVDKQNFGTDHFYKDAIMKLRVISPNSQNEEFEGALAVCQRLLKFPKEELVLFNPNLDTDGFKIVSDPHGLKTLTVCGTVHKDGGVVGLFEQQFGLVRDIHLQNNWKIKFTKLRLQVGAASEKPSLQNTRQMLSIASS